jgi:phenylalanyl-tRNA synthetase beta chain
MKFSERWLREWVSPDLDTEGLVRQLTMAGLEVDSAEPAAGEFEDIVVGEVTAVAPHPDADRLRVCTVDDGVERLQIVCGAPNVVAGGRYPLARVGAALPGGLNIKKAKLRGVESRGMLCSEKELGLGEGAGGLMTLPPDAPVGEDFRHWLELPDTAIDVDLTPNRGDCFSVVGLAREVGVLNGLDLQWPDLAAVPASTDAVFPVEIRAADACRRFAGRVIRGIDPRARTPLWMRERLRRSGLRPIHPVVDVTNYVMLELGQPMHGFDLGQLDTGVIVRMAEEGEQLTLLDGKEVTLDTDMLVIADHGGARAVAGIMGGETSAVTGETTDVFFESAFFEPLAIAGRARRLGLHTDASARFERGVDPTGQERAVERATELLVAIAGGEPGPVVVTEAGERGLGAPIRLRAARLERVLGHRVPDAQVGDILSRLGMAVTADDDSWRVTAPPWRFDVEREEDLIEEVARVYGYDNIPEARSTGLGHLARVPETERPLSEARRVLVQRGYSEVVTYSFVDPVLQSKFAGGQKALALENPISSELAEMRLSLLPGLVAALIENASRQITRVKIFESGLRFVPQSNELKQIETLSGLAAGDRWAEQWGTDGRVVDFFDGKADVEALLAMGGQPGVFRFEAAEHPALHPGQSARVLKNGEAVGWIGTLHPGLAAELDLAMPAVVFELDLVPVLAARIPEFQAISRFPAIRRDLAVVVNQDVPAADLVAAARAAGGPALQAARVFDVYVGEGIEPGLKSVALSLILQDSSRTLTDEDADGAVAAVRERLGESFHARIRD